MSLAMGLKEAEGAHLSVRNGRKMFDALTAAATSTLPKIKQAKNAARRRCCCCRRIDAFDAFDAFDSVDSFDAFDAFNASTQNVLFNGTFSL